MMSRQVLKEVLSSVLSDRRSIWLHLSLPAAGTLFLAMLWPVESLAFFLEQVSGPRTLSVVTLTSAAFIFAAGGAYTLDRIPRETGYSFIKWLRYTPVGPFSYLNARICFHFVHVFLLVMLILPALVLAGAASMISPVQILSVAGFLGLISFCQRVAAEAGRRDDKTTGSLGFLVYVILLVSYLLLTLATFPEWSAVNVLRVLSTAGAGEFGRHAVLKTATLHLVLGVFGYAISIWRLRRCVRVERAS